MGTTPTVNLTAATRTARIRVAVRQQVRDAITREALRQLSEALPRYRTWIRPDPGPFTPPAIAARNGRAVA